MGDLTALPTERTAGGLCAHDIGSTILFRHKGARHSLKLAAVHHDTGTEGQPVTYIANAAGVSHILPSDTPVTQHPHH